MAQPPLTLFGAAQRAMSAQLVRMNAAASNLANAGTVTGSDYIYHHLRSLVDDRKLPMVVSMGSLAASGGYYSAMACGKQENAIFAEPTTWTGSIGVLIPHYSVACGSAP